MKLWQKNSTRIQAEIENFTVGQDRELDLELAPFDVIGSLAHVQMLGEVGLLEKKEVALLQQGLRMIYREMEAGDFYIMEGVEDVHSQVELLLTERLGEAGKKIHSGRSRNDQVLVDLRLFFRSELAALARDSKALFEQLQVLSERYKDILLPGYTHLQVAMVSSFGLWFGAYAESLVDDLQQLLATYRIINQNPLGSAAGYGSSFPLKRGLTTELLGFDDLNYNVVHAQMGRGKTELSLSFTLASFGSTLGKMAMDMVLYSNQNFGFIRFPDSLTTGSSIMPHKKNPDVFELVRARCNQLLSLPAQMAQLTGNLPSGYHRDFQLLKETLFPAIRQARDVLSISLFALERIQVQTDLLESETYKYLYSVEEVNRAVLQGVPFRDAYRQVGEQIEAGHFQPDRTLKHSHEGSLGNLCTEAIKAKWERVWKAFPFKKVEQRLRELLKQEEN